MAKILLVDDDTDDLRTMAEILKTAGHQIKSVRNGSLAIESLEGADSFDAALVIVDLNMPVMNGLQLTKHLRHNDFSKPIILICGYITHQQRARRFGTSDFISKPFKETEIKEIVGRYCKS